MGALFYGTLVLRSRILTCLWEGNKHTTYVTYSSPSFLPSLRSLLLPSLPLPSPPSLLLQVAIIAGNFDLAEIIKIHKVSDVGE